MRFLSRLDDFENIIIDGSVSTSGLSSVYIKDATTPILRIGSNTGDSFITYDGTELSVSSDVDLRLTTPTDQDVFLITSSGNIVTTQGGGNFTIGGGLTLGNFGAGLLQTDANGVVSLDTTAYLPSSSYVAPGIEAGGGTPALATGVTAAEIRTLIDVDQAGTDNSTNVTLAGSYDYLTLSGQEITLGQVDYSTDISNLPTLGTAAASAATDFVAVTGDDMTGALNITVPNANTSLSLKRDVSGTVYTYGSFNNAGPDFNINGTANVFINADSNSDSTSTDRNVTIGNRGVEYMRVRYDGNVGIGTTSPSVRLHVNGEGIFDDYLTLGVNNTDGKAGIYFDESNTASRATSAMYITYDGTNVSGDNNNLSLGSLKAGVGDVLKITYGGNVGIGLTGPTEKLHVSGNILATGTITASNFSGSSSGTNTGDQTTITGNAGSATVLQTARTINGTSFDGSANITTSSWGTARTVTIGSTGKSVDGSANVSWSLAEIGAQPAGSYLTAEADTLSTVVARGSSTASGITVGSLSTSGNITTNANIKAQGYLLFDYDGDFTGGNYYSMEDHSGGYFRMGYAFNSNLVISTSGSIGINTTAPESTSLLHAVNTSAAAKITLETSDSYDSLFNFSAATNEYSVGFKKSDNTFRIANANTLDSNVHFVIASGGNVGIGTTSPGTKLDVIGTVRSYSSAGNYGQIANGSFFAVGSHSGTFMLDLDNTGTADLVNIKNSGASRLYVANGGNVGMGTASPSTKLHVVGTAETRLRVGSSNASSNVVIELRDENSPTGQGTVITYNNATGETYFNNALSTATTDFHFQSGEYGTASDFFALSDAGGNSIVQLSTATGDAFITYEDAINELAIASDGDLRLTTPTDQDVFYISSGGNIDMTQAGGNVDMGGQLTVASKIGIGTDTPSKLLTVGGSTATSGIGNNGIFVNIDGGAAVTAKSGTSGVEVQLNAESSTQGTIGTYSNHPLAFRVNNFNSMYINTSNNVGVGNTAPVARLHVTASTNSVEVLRVDNTAGNSGSVQGITHLGLNFFGVGNNSGARITSYQEGVSGYRGGMYFSTRGVNSDSAPTEAMRITPDQLIGLGPVSSFSTTHRVWIDKGSSTYAVYSQGSIQVNAGAIGVGVTPSATTGRIDAGNDIVAYSSSDERLKENIKPIENALEKVKSLTGVEFDWKPEHKEAHGYEGHDTGVIAQQVQDIIPSAVRENETGFLAVRYEKLIGLLIEGMKEQQTQIDELKAKLNGLAE